MELHLTVKWNSLQTFFMADSFLLFLAGGCMYVFRPQWKTRQSPVQQHDHKDSCRSRTDKDTHGSIASGVVREQVRFAWSC